ncbi:MAG TPA: adenylosuccinate synthase [Actinomycetota bacterium]
MPVTVLVGTQWGDEGKGRAVDVLSERADMVVRCQGGTNAGHTVIAGDTELKLRLIPSSILRPAVPAIGDGVVIDPQVLLEEIDALAALGISTERLLVSGNAHLVMPYHRVLDRVIDRHLGRASLGTTKKGIGPAYADKASRIGLRVQDLLDMKIFAQKLELNLREKNAVLAKIYNQLPIDAKKVIAEYEGYAERLRPFIADTSLAIDRAIKDGRQVLLEGAQGTLLDIDHGTYPFVTSSQPTAAGACTGAGIGPRAIDRVVGATKAHCTRVGTGPFPTEIDGPVADRLRGVKGEQDAEFGTVTGRARRMGWLDGVLLRYAVRLNSLDELWISKLDKLTGVGPLKVAVAYRHEGTTYEDFPPHQSIFHKCEPVYEELEGWTEDVSGARSFEELPAAARAYVARVEEIAGVPASFVSVGPEREQVVRSERVPVTV